MNDYFTLHQEANYEQVINKSRFITDCFPVKNESEIIEITNKIRKKHYKATHCTYAYVLGDKKNIQKCSDDGEPSGTAGKPILDVILSKDLTNILVIVTRYFGGVKLGAGGLIRAYSSSAALGINESIIIKKQYSEIVTISIEYNLLGKLKNKLVSEKYTIEKVEYSEKIQLILYVPNKTSEDLINLVRDITNDNFNYKIVEKKYIEIII